MMKFSVFSILLILGLFSFGIFTLGLAVPGLAQECGPMCPVCSGSGQSAGTLLAPGSIVASALYIPEGEDETGVLNLRMGLASWVDIGLGYTVDSEKPIWSLRFMPVAEDESSWRPAIVLGTGSVQTGGNDQSVFIQATKAVDLSGDVAVRFSAGLAGLVPDLDRGYFLAGMTMIVAERWSPFFTYAGRSFHMGLAWIPNGWLFVSGLLVETKTPALMVGSRWSF